MDVMQQEDLTKLGVQAQLPYGKWCPNCVFTGKGIEGKRVLAEGTAHARSPVLEHGVVRPFKEAWL